MGALARFLITGLLGPRGWIIKSFRYQADRPSGVKQKEKKAHKISQITEATPSSSPVSPLNRRLGIWIFQYVSLSLRFVIRFDQGELPFSIIPPPPNKLHKKKQVSF